MKSRGGLPRASSAAAEARMKATRQRDTPGELSLRRLLYARGLRYRIDAPVIQGLRRRADLVFRRARVAVFVDGCFWHGCPEHGTWPKKNGDWWRAKIEANIARDRDTDARLEGEGWGVVRIWEHEDPEDGADRVQRLLESR